MTEQQKSLVEPILSTIENDDIREFATVLLDGLPNYIWDVPASSTGKYHPAYSLGAGGLMRHQIAVVRFLNFFFELEQYNTKITDRQRDLLRVAGLVHDGRKSGEQMDYEKSKYTKFDHPLQMAEAIRKYDGQYLNHEELEFVASCIESHMGQWSTDKKSSVILPKPTSGFQKLLHLADYLASRKCITMDFEGYAQTAVELPDVDTYIVPFGRYKGELLIDVFNNHYDYIQWMKDNGVNKEPMNSLVKLLEKTKENNV